MGAMPDSLLQELGGGAALAAAFAIVKLVLDAAGRRGDHLLDLEERARGHERDAESRLERLLRDLLDQADRRAAAQAETLAAERARRLSLERECAALRRAELDLRRQQRDLRQLAQTLLAVHALAERPLVLDAGAGSNPARGPG
jgi:hypothetical protein